MSDSNISSPRGRWIPSRFRTAGEFLIFLLMIFFALRVVLLAVFVPHGSLSLVSCLRLFFVGLRFDLLAAGIVLAPILALFGLRTGRKPAGRLRIFATHAFLFIVIYVILFLQIIEYFFFEEFESRLNYIAFEYLAYPTEVIGNIRDSYPLGTTLVLVGVIAAGAYLILRPRITSSLQDPAPARRRWAFLGVVVLLELGLLGITPMSATKVSGDRVANEISANGICTFFYYAWTSRFDYAAFYRTIDPVEAGRRVYAQVAASGDSPVLGSPNPLDRFVETGEPLSNWNVVLILEESLGSDFIGALGDKRGLTPRFDALARDGILMDNFYATGNRTGRALEAVLASFPPIPVEPILVRDHNARVYTLARVLEQRGYRRTYIYAGYGRFDGMRAFSMPNGFEQFIEQKDFKDPVFSTIWGVSDEDLFTKAIETFDQFAADSKPFFATVVTVSNHKPFTYPDGRIDLPAADRKRDNAVKYADWALGNFFERARSHAFYRNTLFIIFGDHGARIYGAQLFPVKSYRVPVLFIPPAGETSAASSRASSGATEMRCHTLASMLDIPPTIMGFLGGSYRSVFFGRDARHIDPATARALMQHNHDLGILDARNHFLVLGARKQVSAYTLDTATWQLTPTDHPDSEAVADAVSYFQVADHLYYNNLVHPAD